MKILTFILAFIILFAAFLPCADAAAVQENHSIQLSTNHQHSAPLDTDFCSPFCICSCCGTSVLTPSSFPIVDTETDYNVFTASFISADISSISLPIWQPPQLLS